MQDRKSCAIIGPSPLRFAWGFDEEDDVCKIFKIVLLQNIQRLQLVGVNDFMVACDPGVGLWSAEIVNTLRGGNSDLRLYCHTPYEEQATKWAPYLRDRYFNMLAQCTYISSEHQMKVQGAQTDAYKTIIRQADMVLAVYDDSTPGGSINEAIQYINKEKKPLVRIHPDTFEVSFLFQKV